jgi:hypothetical protein
MAKPWVHAQSSSRRFGGKPEDYISIHNHLDATKGAFADNWHCAITHNAWYVGPDGPLERIFGVTIINSEGVPVRSVAEQHILEGFGSFIPTLQDFLVAMEYKPWMNGQGDPPSRLNTPSGTRLGD